MPITPGKLIPKEIPLSGRLIKYQDGATIGNNDFRGLVNLRYRDAYPVIIGGQTKINAAQLPASYREINSGIHFKKPNPPESHLVVSTEGGRVYKDSGGNTVPAQVGFDTTPIWTDAAGAGKGRFSDTPQEGLAYCNGKEAVFWGGDRFRIAKFIIKNAINETFDYTDQVTNSLSTDDQVATVKTKISTGADINTLLLLHLDNNVTDSSPTTPHAATNNNVTFETTDAIGTHRAVFNGTNANLVIDPTATSPNDFDFSSGVFTIDGRITNNASIGGTRRIYYQQGATSDEHISLYLLAGVYLRFAIYSAGNPAIYLSGPSLASGVKYHVAVVENGNNWYMFVNGNLVANTTSANRAASYTGNVYIGSGASGEYFLGRLDEFRISNSARWTANFTPQSTAYDDSLYFSTMYVGSIYPVDAVSFELETANANAGTCNALIAEQYKEGGWGSVVSVSDTTGKLASDGLVYLYGNPSTFDPLNELDVPFYFEKQYLYWYRFILQGTVDFSATKIKRVMVRIPPQKMKDLWDGIDRPCASFVFKNSSGGYNDLTVRVADPDFMSDNTFSYVKFKASEGTVQQITATTEFIVGFPEQMAGVGFGIDGAKANVTQAAMTAYYYDGTGYVLASGQSDGTSKDSATLARSGAITWSPPDLNQEFTQTEFPGGPFRTAEEVIAQSTLPGLIARVVEGLVSKAAAEGSLKSVSADVPLYLYKFTFSGDLSDDINIYYIYGIPARKPIRGFSVPCCHQARLVLADNADNKRNLIAVSSALTPNVFNGTDCLWEPVGGADPIVAMKPLFLRYSSVVSDLLVICKEKETYILDGVGSTDNPFKFIRVSDSIGCVAPYTMVTVPVGTADVTGIRRQAAIWQASHGIVMFDGVNVPVTISKDIGGYFDPTHSDYLGETVLAGCRGFYNPEFNEYNWVVPGSTLEFAFDLEKQKWFEINRGDKWLNGGFTAVGSGGIQHAYGFSTSGYVYHLEDGTTFDGDSIVPDLTTADIAPFGNHIFIDSWFNGYKVVCKAKSGTVQVTWYGDTDTGGKSLNSFSSAASGKRLRDHVTTDERLGPAIFHGLRLYNAEPLMLLFYCEPTQPDIIDV